MTRSLLRSSAVLAVAVAALASAPPATAQVVTVTVKSAGGVLDDLRYLVNAVAPKEQAQPLLDALDRFKDPATLKGLDLKRPLGATLDLPKDPNAPPTPSVVIFVPVTDGKAFLATLQQQGFAVDANAGAPGFSHKVTPPGNGSPPLFTVLTPAYAYFSMVPVNAQGITKMKPADLLPKRPDAGAISISARLDRVPAQYKELAIAQMEQAAAKQNDKREGESDDAYKARQAVNKGAQAAINGLIREGKELTIDLGVDAQRAELAAEFGLSTAAGSPSAAAIKRLSARQSIFRGIGKGAAVQGWADVAMSGAIRTAVASGFDQARKDAEKEAGAPGAKLIDDLKKALQPTLAGDEADFGMAAYGPFPAAKTGKAPTYAALLGFKVKGGKALDKSFRDFAAKAKDKEKVQLKLDAAKAGDVAIHRFRVEPDTPMLDVYGEPLVFVAFRDDVALAAYGQNGQQVITQALDTTKQPPTGAAAPVDFVASIAKLARMSGGPNRDAVLNLVGEVFQGKDASKDSVRLNVRGAGDVARLRLTADVPVLRYLVKLNAARRMAPPAAAQLKPAEAGK